MKNNNIYIESCDTNNLSIKDITEIAEVEKDMWSYWIGEYVRCKNCWNIHSKNDIYWHLEYEIKIESVTKIENILSLDSIRCVDCNDETEFVYDINTNIETIKERYNESESYLSLARSNEGKIIWFCDGYIDNLETIYDRFFDFYYPKLWLNWLEKILNKELNNVIPNELLVWTAVWTEEKYKSFYVFYNLMKSFFYSIDNLKILWISDSVIWTNTEGVYSALWAKRLGVTNFNIANYNTDIFIHENVVSDYQMELKWDVKTFLKKYWKQMRWIIQNWHK